jgi:hypothetical protein
MDLTERHFELSAEGREANAIPGGDESQKEVMSSNVLGLGSKMPIFGS